MAQGPFFPAAMPGPSPQPRPEPRLKPTMDNLKRILIVEDDVDIANVLSLHLRDERYEVVHSADGNEGCACWNKAAGTR
jgi:two-component system OmpR family response regulator